MTDPTPEPGSWQDFYANPQPSPPSPPSPQPPDSSAVIKRMAFFAAIAVGGLFGQWVVRWAIAPGDPPVPAAEQRAPAVEIPPALIERFLSPTPTVPPRKITVVAPDKINGSAKSTDADLTKVATDEGTRMQSLPQVTGVAAAVYGSHAKKNVTLILAAAAKVSTSDADVFVNNALTGSDVVVQPATYDAGPLGGRAVCGEAKSQGVQYAVCGWADDGSLGLIIRYYTSVAKLQTEFHALRAEIERVS